MRSVACSHADRLLTAEEVQVDWMTVLGYRNQNWQIFQMYFSVTFNLSTALPASWICLNSPMVFAALFIANYKQMYHFGLKK